MDRTDVHYKWQQRKYWYKKSVNHISIVIRINPYHDSNGNNAAVLQAEREDKMVTSSKVSCSSNHLDNNTDQDGIPNDIQDSSMCQVSVSEECSMMSNLSNTDDCVNCSHYSAQDPILEVEQRLSKRKKPIFKSNDFLRISNCVIHTALISNCVIHTALIQKVL